MTINFYNETGNTDLYLFFDYAKGATSLGITGFDDMSYLQPWKDGTLALDAPYTCSFDWIDSGTFWYIVTNATGAATIAANPAIPLGTADKNWVGGFFELTSLERDNYVYFDITNVDAMGLACGIKFSDDEHCGYGHSAMDMISGLETACDVPDTSAAIVKITGTDGVTYKKLWGPTVEAAGDVYTALYKTYLDKIKANGTTMTFNADSTMGSTHGGTQLPSFKFTGGFGQPATIPSGTSLQASDVVMYFTATDCPTAGETTTIYFTADAINPLAITSGNSAKGMYVHKAFEYGDGWTPDPNDPDNTAKGTPIIKSADWAENVSLNWTATGIHAVAETTCFQAMISSVGRDLVTALNLGYIGITAEHNAFIYKEESTYASAETQATYINPWNQYITDNSDSYGMAYSDGTHAKVQFHPPVTGTINCHILKQDDANTGTYWSKSTSVSEPA